MMVAILLSYLLFVGVAAGLLSRWRLNWSRWRVIAVSAVPIPALLLIASGVGFVGSFLDQPLAGETARIDARYHAMGAYLMLVMAVPILLLMSAAISWLAVRLMKR